MQTVKSSYIVCMIIQSWSAMYDIKLAIASLNCDSMRGSLQDLFIDMMWAKNWLNFDSRQILLWISLQTTNNVTTENSLYLDDRTLHCCQGNLHFPREVKQLNFLSRRRTIGMATPVFSLKYQHAMVSLGMSFPFLLKWIMTKNPGAINQIITLQNNWICWKVQHFSAHKRSSKNRL